MYIKSNMMSVFIIIGIVWVVGGVFLIYHCLIKRRFLLALLSFVLTSAPVLGGCYVIHIASEYVDAFFSATDSDIEHLFTEITGESIPPSAMMIEKEGDYGFLDSYKTAIIRMDTADYNKIHAIFSTDSIFKEFSSPDTIWTTHVERLKLLQKAKISEIGFDKYKLGYKEIGFGHDKRHIIIKEED